MVCCLVSGRNIVVFSDCPSLTQLIRYILEKPNLYNTSHSPEQLSKWRTLYARLYDGMQRVWQDTHDILCNDAPEGYMPEELEGDASSLTTKDILSYSWRALKESSLVVRALAVRCPVPVSYTHLTLPTIYSV